MPICGNCGGESVDQFVFCPHCGSRFHTPPHAGADSVDSLQQTRMRLLAILRARQSQLSSAHSAPVNAAKEMMADRKRGSAISKAGCLAFIALLVLTSFLSEASPLLCKALGIAAMLFGFISYLGGLTKATDDTARIQNKSIDVLREEKRTARRIGGWAFALGIIAFGITLQANRSSDAPVSTPVTTSSVTISGETGEAIGASDAKEVDHPSDQSTSTPSNDIVKNSEWDGAVSQVVSWLRRNLKDPRSLEFIEWSPVQKTETGYVVRAKYRARNSFGGYVIENQLFYLDFQGTVVDVVNWD